MTVMTRDGLSPFPRSLRHGLAAHQPSKRHHAQSLLGPSFYALSVKLSRFIIFMIFDKFVRLVECKIENGDSNR